MVQCAIEGCSSRSDTQPSGCIEGAVHFHRIPRASLIRQKWMQAINKREVKNSARICSLHFKKENYYLTEQGFHKLAGGSVPEIKLPVEEILEDSSDEEMTNVLPPEQNIRCRSQSQQTSTKEITPENGTKDNVSGSSNIKHVEDVKDETTDASCDDEMPNVQPQEQNISYDKRQCQFPSTKEITPEIGITDNVLGTTSIKHAEDDGDTADSSEDEKMTNVQPQEENIKLPNQCLQNISKEMTTDNVKGSSTTKPGVQKHKVKTPLERKLLKEVRRLQEQGNKKMEAISCLLEQNRRLLDRNSFLEKSLNKKVAKNANNVAQQEYIYLKFK